MKGAGGFEERSYGGAEGGFVDGHGTEWRREGKKRLSPLKDPSCAVGDRVSSTRYGAGSCAVGRATLSCRSGIGIFCCHRARKVFPGTFQIIRLGYHWYVMGGCSPFLKKKAMNGKGLRKGCESGRECKEIEYLARVDLVATEGIFVCTHSGREERGRLILCF